MHASYAEKGLSILGFPCNQFGGQASSDNSLQIEIEHADTVPVSR